LHGADQVKDFKTSKNSFVFKVPKHKSSAPIFGRNFFEARAAATRRRLIRRELHLHAGLLPE
jgi:hypothetical protein